MFLSLAYLQKGKDAARSHLRIVVKACHGAMCFLILLFIWGPHTVVIRVTPLPLCSEVTPDSARGTLWDTTNQTWVTHV